MRTFDLRLLLRAGALSGALLTTACFTPPELAQKIDSSHHAEDEAAHGEVAHGVAEVEHDVPGDNEELGEREKDVEGEAHDPDRIVEGIIPGTEGRKLDIKAPEIPFKPPFDGKPLSEKELAKGVVIQDYVVGDGEGVVEGQVVEFSFTGYASATAVPVMGSKLKPAKLLIDEANRKRDPIAAAMADGLLGMKVGGKRKIKVPASIIEKNAPPGRPAMGDLWMAVEVLGVSEPFEPQPEEAFDAKPVKTQKLDGGLEIYDITAGEGPAASSGYQVTAHYIGKLDDGTVFDTSHERAEGISVTIGAGGVIPGFATGLEGVKQGMLRKLVIPPELGYGPRASGKIPPNSRLTFLLEITEVKEGRPLPMAPGRGQPPAGKPSDKAGDKPKGDEPAKGDKPEKPAKPKKPAEGDDGE